MQKHINAFSEFLKWRKWSWLAAGFGGNAAIFWCFEGHKKQKCDIKMFFFVPPGPIYYDKTTEGHSFLGAKEKKCIWFEYSNINSVGEKWQEMKSALGVQMLKVTRKCIENNRVELIQP